MTVCDIKIRVNFLLLLVGILSTLLDQHIPSVLGQYPHMFSRPWQKKSGNNALADITLIKIIK